MNKTAILHEISLVLRCGTRMVGALAGGLLAVQPASADFFLNSNATNQVMRFDEVTGTRTQLLPDVQGPYAAQIGYNGDYFVSGNALGEVVRFNSETGALIGHFIRRGVGGLQRPTAPNFGPDGKFYVGDVGTNSILKYDPDGNFVEVFTNKAASGLDGPYMQAFDATTQFQTSFNTNSILRYDVATEEFLGAFVSPGSGGLMGPVGLEFGPDGNLYTSSSATNQVLRYDGQTGAFIDAFVPAGSGGLGSPRAIRFGGPNSDLYVVSWNNNRILRYDRTTGNFVGVVTLLDRYGVVGPRGLTFSPRPAFFVRAVPAVVPAQPHGWTDISVGNRLQDFTDAKPRVRLDAVSLNDLSRDPNKDLKKADFGNADYEFRIRSNQSCSDRVYTFSYSATNSSNVKVIATTTVTVAANKKRCSDNPRDWLSDGDGDGDGDSDSDAEFVSSASDV